MHAPAEEYLRRFSLASPLAMSITAGLFVLLVVLTTDRTEYVPVIKAPRVEHAPLPDKLPLPDEDTVRPIPPPEPVIGKEPLKVPPVDEETTRDPPTFGGNTWVYVPPGPTDPTVGIDSRDPLVVFVPRPDYPERARSKGIEGYAIIAFTVTAAGTIRDPQIVEASPAGYFEKAAVTAAYRARFQPKLVDGEPVEAPGVMYRFVFNLEN